VQSKNQNDSVQLSTRYQQYDFAKRHLRGTRRPEVFPFEGSNGETQREHGEVVPMKWRRTEKGKQFRREAQKKGRDSTPFGTEHRELVPKKPGIIGTITSQAIAKDSLLGHGDKVRRLTPTECERLQGFLDGWTEGVSDTQRYKTLGNAVTVNVIRDIIYQLLVKE